MIILNNKQVNTDVMSILNKAKLELNNGKLSKFSRSGNEIKVTCPHHSSGLEKNESCFIQENGVFHCFACNFKGTIDDFIGECFDRDKSFGRDWILNNFEYSVIRDVVDLPKIDFRQTESIHLNEKILDSYQSYHPYLAQRKLSRNICEKFKVKYDTQNKCIVFPVWDENNNLVMFTRRSVESKKFIIDKDVEKPVYLLNFINQMDTNTVFVCESQINALTCFEYGYPAIALFGTGTSHQYNILNKSKIRRYILCFDGDEAGDKGTERFIKNIRKDVFVDVIKIPRGKDVNDLTREEFLECVKKCT